MTDTAEGSRGERGYSILELLIVLGLAATLTGAAVPGASRALARYRAAGAARLVRATLQRARASAVSRAANVAVRFVSTPAGIKFAVYADANRNGVSAADIAGGIDVELEPLQSLTPFAGVAFGIGAGVVSPDGTPFGSPDPIRVGGASMVSFSPAGGATSGTIYIAGAGGAQYAVRVYGDTGKTQLLRYLAGSRTWEAE